MSPPVDTGIRTHTYMYNQRLAHIARIMCGEKKYNVVFPAVTYGKCGVNKQQCTEKIHTNWKQLVVQASTKSIRY